MNGKSFVVSTAKRVINLFELFQGAEVEMEVVGVRGMAYLLNSENDPRTSENTVTSSGANDETKTFTVADSSLFRVGETILIFDGSDNLKGSCKIDSIPAGGVTVVVKQFNSVFVIESGDKLYYPADSILADYKTRILDTTQAKKLTIISLESSSDLNLIITPYDSKNKKKN